MLEDESGNIYYHNEGKLQTIHIHFPLRNSEFELQLRFIAASDPSILLFVGTGESQWELPENGKVESVALTDALNKLAAADFDR